MLPWRVSTLLLFFSHTLVTAYSLPGGYERVLYYHIYLLDIAANHLLPKNVAHDCHKVMRTGGIPCSFDQFVEHIRYREPGEAANTKNYPRITNKDYEPGVAPPVDDTADKVNQMKLSNRITPGYVHRNLMEQRMGYDRLLVTMGDELKQLIERLDSEDPLVKKTVYALEKLCFARQDATFKTFAEAVAKKQKTDARWKEPEVVMKDAHHGLEVKMPSFRHKEYAAANGLDVEEVKKLWKDNEAGGHSDNNLALKNALKAALAARGKLCPAPGA